MLQKLREYIKDQHLIEPTDRLLIAVSGGIDSMVLLHLLNSLPYYIEVAHMNFGLRGEESDGDQQLVEDYCNSNNIKLHVQKVDTLSYLKEHKLSVQMAARDLRYEWFEKLKSENNLSKVLTAHHSDDSIETVFINIIRGTGFSGLKGIVNNNRAIRPLLKFNRAEILHYAEMNSVQWREDSSNAKQDYLRNKLRLTILPLFDELNTNWRDSFIQLSDDLAVSEGILNTYYSNHISEIYKDSRIDLNKRDDLEHFEWLFRKLLLSLNFSNETISDILSNLELQTGKEFESSTHKIIKEHNSFDVLLKEEQSPFIDSSFILENDQLLKVNNKVIEFQKTLLGDFNQVYIAGEAYLDYNKLRFPLLLRRWEHGDWFMPFGMKGKKKLSDFFVDEKFTIREKENTFVIVSGEDIVCILGHRTDDRYKITEGTSIIYNIKQKHG